MGSRERCVPTLRCDYEVVAHKGSARATGPTSGSSGGSWRSRESCSGSWLGCSGRSERSKCSGRPSRSSNTEENPGEQSVVYALGRLRLCLPFTNSAGRNHGLIRLWIRPAEFLIQPAFYRYTALIWRLYSVLDPPSPVLATSCDARRGLRYFISRVLRITPTATGSQTGQTCT